SHKSGFWWLASQVVQRIAPSSLPNRYVMPTEISHMSCIQYLLFLRASKASTDIWKLTACVSCPKSAHLYGRTFLNIFFNCTHAYKKSCYYSVRLICVCRDRAQILTIKPCCNCTTKSPICTCWQHNSMRSCGFWTWSTQNGFNHIDILHYYCIIVQVSDRQ